MNTTNLRISVIVCTYNGSRNISNCLRSLLDQSIPRNDYEVIVVDDCSNDPTPQMLQEFDVTKIRNETNSGLSYARNAGLAAARAPIVAFTDDDCVADHNWLEMLLTKFDDSDVVGVGGKIMPNTEPNTLAVRYLSENNPLLPVLLADVTNKNTSQRLRNYLVRLVQPFNQDIDNQEIYALIGANMSFRRNALNEIYGFDATLKNSAEDEDVCKRIRAWFPDKKLIFTNKAVINHIFDTALGKSFRRNLSYGKNSAKLYLKHPGHSLIIFPFPFVFAVTILVGALLGPVTFIGALLSPIIFYPSGLIKLLKKVDTYYFIDPYVHLVHDVYSNIGFFQGYLEMIKEQE